MQEYRIWECLVCGWVYDESKGAPEDGIAPGTRWEDVPKDWQCPECGVGKDDFEMIEVRRIAMAADNAAAAESPDKPLPSPVAASSDVDFSRAPVVIIGTGLAGYHLAKELRKLDQTTPLIMISADDGAHYSKPQLSTAFHKQRSPLQLVSNTAREMAETLNAQILTFTRVTAMDTASRVLTMRAGAHDQQLHYGKLVLAMGSDPVEIPMAGSAAGCAYSINDLQDFQRFYTGIAGARSVLVIGGGLIGCEYANDLIQAGFDVHVVEPQTQLLGSLIPPAAGDLVQNALTRAGVHFHLGTTVKNLDHAAGSVRVELADGSQLQVDRVISAIGVRPRVDLAQHAGVRTTRGIVTDRYLATSAEQVFALGDCADVDGHNLCYIAPLLAGARALAQTLAGSPTPVHYGNMPVSIKTTLCPVTVSPPPCNADGQWQYERSDSQGVIARFIASDGQLQGFALAGDACKQAPAFSEQTAPIMQN
ncbi:FAD-dependent oxidoreductase [Microbulbifer hydrolyticus]|uniref:FAD-dependent oxidoreductase n=1 Tax=Microbulbifer hydrolyticus TaxID=48074 RepID=A0A6P1TF00_9GAMM|nr:FAD-dependent oxidoreductase [Microbulbifer hydrolyticus]MBB5210141.1 rubredoxin-NAD+ reductase [Microbulbifer hydrolyticus]QHQ39342.1 FAD-dependent oxidoreductase [Microbulbifer hydrolyticus]